MNKDIVTGQDAALVLSGGIALGAFHGGAVEALLERGVEPGWIVGSSIGSVTAALVAGGEPQEVTGRLRRLWDGVAIKQPVSSAFEMPTAWRGWEAWSAAVYAHVFGRPGLFIPRVPRVGPDDRPGLYDLTPLRDRLVELVDFDRLNDGPIRVSMVAADVLTGERRVFDTRRGDRIGVDHVLASCAFMPLFAPVEIDGRVLVDGGFAANLPVDVVLEAPGPVRTCYAVDLFAPAGQPPRGIVSGLSRAGDLMFGNQSRLILEKCAREQALRQTIARLGALVRDATRSEVEALIAEGRSGAVQVVVAGYRGVEGEAGPEKGFDFSRGTIERRWAAGRVAMRGALADEVG